MKKKLFPLLAVSILLILETGCGSITYTGAWIDEQKLAEKSYQTIFVAAMTDNVSAKRIIENDLKQAIEARGFSVVLSSDHFKPNFNRENAADEQQVMNQIRSLGCDGILTACLIDESSETRYVEGNTTYIPYPRYGYYGRYWPYYRNRFAMVYEPGYYTQDHTYYFENNFYDAETEDLLFSMQSKTMNPPQLERFSKEYAAALLKQIEKNGIISK